MNIALITEGVSEHRVIKHFINRYLRGFDIDINQIQPEIHKNKQQNTGGWNEVLKYCGRDEIKDILIENDYLIIQVDSDMSETKPFSVEHSSDGQAKSYEELCNDIINKLKSLIQPEILNSAERKILFAVCIHTVECWLLPFYCSDNKRSSTTNCLATLNRCLASKNMRSIPSSDKNGANAIKAYGELLAPIKKNDLISASDHNIGLKKFLESLNDIVSESQVQDSETE